MIVAINIAIFLIGSLVGLVVSCLALISGVSNGVVVYIKYKYDDDFESIRCLSAKVKDGYLLTEFPDNKIVIDSDIEFIKVEGE